MRNKNPLIKAVMMLIALLLVIMFLVSYAGAGKEYIADSQNTEITEDEGSVHYENISITYEKQMPKDIPEQIRLAVIELPVEVVKAFIDDEWKIAIVSTVELPEDANIDATIDETDTVIGVTNYKTKTIQVLYDEMQQSVTAPLMHELSHYCDKYYGEKYYAEDSLYRVNPGVYLVSFTKDFEELYKNHKNTYLEYEKAGIARTEDNRLDFEYPVSNSEEFFACSLKDFFLHPAYLKDNYKEIYDFFEEKLINAESDQQQ